MKKVFLLFLAVTLLLCVCAGCSSQESGGTSSAPVSSATETTSVESTGSASEKTSVQVLTISGPTGIGMAELMHRSEQGETANDYHFTITTTPSDVLTAIVSGAADIAACPINLASKIYQKTKEGVQILAVNTLGVLYIVTNGKSIGQFSDLNGLDVVAAGEGATPEYAVKYLCEAYGIQIHLQFVDEFSTAATMVASGECQVALLAEPSVSTARMKNPELTVALNLTEVWDEAGEAGLIEKASLAQGCVIVRSDFAAQHPEAVRTFLEEYRTSVTYATDPDHQEQTASLCEQYGIVPKAAVAKMALPNCNLVCITGEEMRKITEKNLHVLFSYDPVSIGGSMPGDSFYYAEN